MAGAGVLGLLIVVAIMMYLMVGPMGGGGAGGAGAPGGGGTSYLGGMRGGQQRGRQLSVEIDHYRLKQYLASWHLDHGSYPKDFAEMGEAESGVWNDNWGTQFRFVIDESTTPGEMTVTSAGRDQTWGTPDDLSHTAPLPF